MNFIQAKASNLNMLKSTVEATNHENPIFEGQFYQFFQLLFIIISASLPSTLSCQKLHSRI